MTIDKPKSTTGNRERGDPASTAAPKQRRAVDRPKTAGIQPRTARPLATQEPAGLDARRLAVRLIEAVLNKGHTLEDTLAKDDAAARANTGADGPGSAKAPMEPRDRAFARLIAATVLRRHGSLMAILGQFLERPLPHEAARARSILLAGAAQILLLETPRHAAINLAVEQCRRDVQAQRFDKLANAVLRRVANDGPARLAALAWPQTDIPEWVWRRWVSTYGPTDAGLIATASLREAPLDISVKSNPEMWAERLQGTVLQTGSIRLETHGRIEDLDGYAQGDWWVQDAAAALPARCLGPVHGMKVADLCAAPGGKTAALANAGAYVTAVDISQIRLMRVRENMQRLGFLDRVETVAADCLRWVPAEPFDAVLLDAPCTATGTIRRHPDLLHLKRADDIVRLGKLQGELLDKASAMVKPGGVVVFCTCSLEPEEGPDIVDAFLARKSGFERRPVLATEIGAEQGWITPGGDLRTFPQFLPRETVAGSGMDGFFASRLVRVS